MKRWYPAILVGSILLSVTLCLAASYIVLSSFTASEVEPVIIPIKQDHQQVIDVSLVIFDFVRFDTLVNRFVFDAIVRFDVPQSLSQEQLEHFRFDRGEIKQKELIEKTIHNDRVIYRYQIRADVSAPLNYTWYPFDDHTLFLTFINRRLSTQDYIFVMNQEQFAVADENLSEWVLHKTYCKSGGIQWLSSQQHELKDKISPAIICGIEYLRGGYTGLLTIIFPLLVIFFIALACFAIDAKATYEAIIQSSIANVAGLLAYRFVIDTVSPATSYLKISDYFFIITLISCLTFAFLNLFTPWLPLSRDQRMVIMLSMISFVTMSYVFLLMYVMQ